MSTTQNPSSLNPTPFDLLCDQAGANRAFFNDVFAGRFETPNLPQVDAAGFLPISVFIHLTVDQVKDLVRRFRTQPAPDLDQAVQDFIATGATAPETEPAPAAPLYGPLADEPNRVRYSPELRAAVLADIRAGLSQNKARRKYGVRGTNTIGRWLDRYPAPEPASASGKIEMRGRRYPEEIKQAIVRQYRNGEPAAKLAQTYGISNQSVYNWTIRFEHAA